MQKPLSCYADLVLVVGLLVFAGYGSRSSADGLQSSELSAAPRAEQVQLAGVFSDHMVLQRDMPVPIWGAAQPGGKVQVTFHGHQATAVADADGRWQVELPAMPASAVPHDLVVQGKTATTITDVLVGDVWLGSGQSNMAWPVSRCTGAQKAIASASNPNIRLFQYSRQHSKEPLADRPGTWRVCGPETVKDFSGVLYFFGKTLQADLDVPIGLINSSVGGTRIERWISRPGLEADPAYRDLVAQIGAVHHDYDGVYQQYQHAMTQWLKEHTDEAEKNRGMGHDWASQDYNDTAWKTMKLPGPWERKLGKLDGAVWFRKTIKIPKHWVGQELTLNLGRIDDYDTTFCNGVNVGVTDGDTQNPWSVNRCYPLPASLVTGRKLVLAVRVFDIHADGGLVGRVPDMYLAHGDEKIPLHGPWRYRVESTHDLKQCAAVPLPPSKPDTGATSLFNAMIHPLVPVALRGVVWYQGESNTGQPRKYQHLLQTLIRDWRTTWKQGDFPFLIVQLPNLQNHQPRNPLPAPRTLPDPRASGSWVWLRESQARAATADPNTGMVVTIDLGDRSDIHPANKAPVGQRLARLAETMVYGKDQVVAGPVYDRMKVQGNRIRLFFERDDPQLVAKGGPLKWFAIAGADRKFVWADATIDGNTVVVSSPKVKRPVAVRYAWSKNPEGCNLYNRTGLPASPFRTDNWDR